MLVIGDSKHKADAVEVEKPVLVLPPPPPAHCHACLLKLRSEREKAMHSPRSKSQPTTTPGRERRRVEGRICLGFLHTSPPTITPITGMPQARKRKGRIELQAQGRRTHAMQGMAKMAKRQV